MTERPTQGEKIAGIAGLALILIMFLFDWFGVDVPRRRRLRRVRRLRRLVQHHPVLRGLLGHGAGTRWQRLGAMPVSLARDRRAGGISALVL